MKALKTKIRNRLEEDHLDLLMRIESYHFEGGLIIRLSLLQCDNKPCPGKLLTWTGFILNG